MLMRIRDVIGRKVIAADGEVGRAKDVYFDDSTRAVRYVVVDTGTWLESREVLLAPSAFLSWEPGADVLVTGLSREKVEASPPVTADMPLSRQYEERLHAHYGWTPYWSFPMVPAPGLYMYPAVPTPSAPEVPSEVRDAMDYVAKESGDPHLRSFSEVKGYHIKATDGEIGHVHDLLFDPDSMRITHLIVDTRNWLPSNDVVIDFGMVEAISWEESRVIVKLTKDRIRNAPSYDPRAAIDESYQARLSSYYRGIGDVASPRAGL